jgi:hypothetical protein
MILSPVRWLYGTTGNHWCPLSTNTKMRFFPLVLCLVLIAPKVAGAQRFEQPKDSCDGYVRDLKRSTTDSLWNWALANLYDCPDHVGPALSTLWRHPPDDTVRWKSIIDVSEFISDEGLLGVVVSVAQSERLPVWHRAAALTTLVAWADSTLRFSITPSGPGLPVNIRYGSIDHPWTRAGRRPLTSDQRGAIRTFLAQRGIADPDSGLRYAARRAVEWIDRNTP